jgi:predicted negative regulator of RcsB-dependent stress response
MNLKNLVIGAVVLSGAYLAYTYFKNKNVTKIKEGSFTIEVQNDTKPNA